MKKTFLCLGITLSTLAWAERKDQVAPAFTQREYAILESLAPRSIQQLTGERIRFRDDLMFRKTDLFKFDTSEIAETNNRISCSIGLEDKPDANLTIKIGTEIQVGKIQHTVRDNTNRYEIDVAEVNAPAGKSRVAVIFCSSTLPLSQFEFFLSLDRFFSIPLRSVSAIRTHELLDESDLAKSGPLPHAVGNG